MGQNRESFHNITIRGIRSNLPELSSCVDEIKMIYSLTHKSIYENEIADWLAKVAAKKAAYLPPRIGLITMSDLKNANTQLTADGPEDWQTPVITNINSLFQQYVKTV